MSTVSELQEAIARQGDRVRELKLAKSPVESEVAELKALKAQLARLQPPSAAPAASSSKRADGAPAAGGKKAGKARAFELKVPKVRLIVAHLSALPVAPRAGWLGSSLARI